MFTLGHCFPAWSLRTLNGSWRYIEILFEISTTLSSIVLGFSRKVSQLRHWVVTSLCVQFWNWWERYKPQNYTTHFFSVNSKVSYQSLIRNIWKRHYILMYQNIFLSALQILCIFLRLNKNSHQFKLIFETKKFGKQCSRINSLLIILVWVNNILINTLQVLFFNYFVSNFIINFSLLWAYRRCFKRTFKKRR